MKPTNTTRMYPRTTLQAFGYDATSACAIERPASHERIAAWMLAVAIALFAVLAIYSWSTEPNVNEQRIEKPCGQNGVLVDGKCYTKHGKKVTK